MSVRKRLEWLGSSLDDLKRFPDDVQDQMGYALYLAQMGEKHRRAKPLSAFKGAGVLEIIDDHDGNTYRAVYTIRFEEAVYALHAFQKKSKSGIATPKKEMDLVSHRLKLAEARHKLWQEQQGK